MGFGRGPRIPLWVVILVICCIQQKASSAEDVPERVTILPPLQTMPVISSFHSAHNGRVCSTWGTFHYKTFDGDIYNFPGICKYVFASHCNAPFEDFNIQLRHQRVGNTFTISYVTVKLDGTDFKIEKDQILVNGKRIHLPYNGPGFEIEHFFNYIKVDSKMGLTLMWNKDDSVMLELDIKYANHTCGLCGDFNGIPKYKEFYFDNTPITDFQFGNQWKKNDPTEDCEDPIPPSQKNCIDEYDICRKTLTGSAFSECNDIVGVKSYIEACVHDLCLCDEVEKSSCLCDTFSEYSRQCAHAGGRPQQWRSAELCSITCQLDMQYQECGSPCANTCTNSERSHVCEDHCIDGCFCPPGTVFDDINGKSCIPFDQCSCIYNGESYAPGMTYSAPCRSCVCSGGEWNCTELPCPGICSIEGGSHISTYDEVWYNFHGKCNYIFTKICDEETFTVLGDLGPCGLTEFESCLKMVALTINGGETFAAINRKGKVIVNGMSAQLPISVANVTIFQPSNSFIVLETNFGLQIVIQIIPLLQINIYLDPSFQGRMCGLCGNFNHNQRDDFKTLNGLIEGTATAFANTWKTQAACDNIKQDFNDPCTQSIENEKYARHWCGLLTDPEGPFAKCHLIVNPKAYHMNCMFDACACEKSENCMCAALSSYVRACRTKGIELAGWRTSACSKYTTSCARSLNYSYEISSCEPTCRSLSEPDITCHIKFVPVDGCTCENGTYMDDSEICVPANKCPCYYKGIAMLPGEVYHEFGVACTCNQGKLNCYGDGESKQDCTAPMIYFDCRNATSDSKGAGCQKSCQTLDTHCYSPQCVSGCICPHGLVSDGKGSCIPVEECPCIHNDATYQPGEKIKVDCNTCICQNRMWKCTMETCLSTCAIYGDGHYITFDDKRYIFNGQCEYTLLQDYCGQNSSTQGSFRIISENIPCGTTGTTCSKSIKVFFKNYELILTEEQYKVVKRESGGHIPYRIHQMGIYLMIEIQKGLIVLWDKKTSVFIKLSAEFKGEVCGLCGNYDGNGVNDFTTRSRSVVGDVLEFGNSWKVSPTCPDAKCVKDPCSKNPYRKAWSQKKCSIINSEVFAACHSQVEPTKYYEACVTDACACDTGGDCECFCTAVAAYAKVCSDHGVCVSWRTPSICPMFCDYYNNEGECEWHYKPCGAPCMKTCRNPSGRCAYHLPGLEGCYPHCPADKPYFSEDEMKCVSICGCYDNKGNYHRLGKTFTTGEMCQSCKCTSEGIISCEYDTKACYCYYEGKRYNYKEVIYNTTDGLGSCITAICDINGTINREVYKCAGITTKPPFQFTTSSATESIPTRTTMCVHKVCRWMGWYDLSYPSYEITNGEYETPEIIRAKGHNLCKLPDKVECRAKELPDETLHSLNQNVTCTPTDGLICNNKDQTPPMCYNFEVRFSCCNFEPCGPLTSTSATKTTAETTPVTETKTSPPYIPQSSTPFVIGTTRPTSQPSTLSSIQPTSTTCHPKCQWTQWFDDHNPNTSPDGDFERFEDIRARGLVCEHPKDIKCQAKDYAHTRNPAPAQNFQCNLDVGLVCEHEKQKQKPYKCVNYQVQFLCCDYSHCQTVTTAVTTGKQTTTTLPTPPSTRLVTSGIISTASTISPSTPLVSTSTAVTTGKQTTTTISTPLSTLVSTSAEVTTGKQTTTTLPTPQSTRLVTSGIISTASTTSPSTPLVTTSTAVTTGKERTTTLPAPPSTRPITSGIISTALTTSPSTSLVSTSTAVTTGKQTTTALPTPSSTQLVTSRIISTAPIVTQRTTLLSTNAEITTRKQITTTLSTPLSTLVSTTSMPITTTTAETMPSTQTKTSHPQSSTPLVIVMTRPTSQPSTPSSIQSTSKSCQPKCQWTQWFDDHNPNTSPDGDFERFEDIRARGLVCEHPKDIKCQAKDYAHTRNPAPAQNFQCNLEVGLVCEHEKQKQKPYKCVNYQVQFLCCDYSHCQTVTTAVTAKPTSAKILYSSTTSSASTLPHTILTTSPSIPPVSTSTAVTTGKQTTTTISTPLSTLVSTSAEVTTGKQTTTTLPAPPSTQPVTSGIISTASTTSPSTPLVSTSTAVTTGKQTTTTLPTPPSTRIVTSGIISTASTTSPSTPLVSTSTAVTTGKQTTTTISTPLSTLVSTSAEVTTGKQTTTTLPAPPSTRPVTSGIISTASTTSPSTPLVSTSTAVTTGKQTTTTLPTPPSTRPVTSGIISTALITSPSTPLVSTSTAVTTGKQKTTTLPTPPSTRLVTSGIISTASTTSPSTPLISTSTAVTTGKQTTTTISTPLSILVSTSAEVTTGKQTTTTLPAPPSTRPVTSGIISTALTTSPSTPLVSTSTAVTTGKQKTTTLPTPPSTRLVTSGIISTASTTSPSTPLVSTSTAVTTGKQTTTTISTPLSILVSTSAEVTTGKQTTTTLPAPPSTRPITSGIISTASTTSPSTPTSTAVTTGKQTTTTFSTPLSTLVSTTARITTGKQTTTALPTPPSTRLVTSGIISTASTTSPSTPVVSTSTTVTKGKQTTTTLPAPPSTRPITSGIMSTLSTTSPSTPLVSTSTAVTTGKQTTTILSPPLSTLVSTSAGLSTGSTLATTLSRVTPCFCHVSGTPDSLFSPGEVIYNTTDHSGCRFIAICDANCEIKRNPVLCPTTTPRPSVTTSGRLPIPTSTTFTPATELHTSPTPRTGKNIFSTPVPDCPDADPPRKFNETWMFNNCTKATCEGSNRIVVVPLPQAEKIVCASGLEPKKIVDEDGCIERYECECICKGWDHYNFMTFDGTSYTFHGNCTYILVKEIVNKYGNLRILLDNAFCDIAVNQSCSRSLIIYYNSMEVRLTSEMHEGVRVNKIFFGNDSVPEGFVKDGIVATSTGVTMMIEMPAISGFVSFNGFTFFIMLSHELFQHNTEGQCGSCSNDRSDDCRKPNGQKADSCSEMAIYWQVPDINKPDCQVEPTTPPIVSTIVPTTPVESTPTPTPCSFPSPLCQLIISDIFAECHKVLSPRQFYDDCLTETCQASNDSSSCIYIDMYASLCTANGACADWRSKTHGKCPYYCAKDKVYAPCAPIHPETCENGVTHENNDHVAERCICPEGTILFNSHTGLCVPECGCVGPDGLPKLPGSKWKSNCQECLCDPLSISVQCKPQSCSKTTHSCEEEGYMPISVLNPEDPCCPQIKCVCNTSLCSKEKKICKPGYHVASISYDDCCGSIKCEIRERICLVNGSVYEPGMTVPGKSCERCICSSVRDPATKRNIVECKPVTCSTDCPMGHEYQVKPGECCGNCIQVACIITVNDTAEILEPGQTKAGNCKQYRCEPRSNILVLVETEEKCPSFDPGCSPDQIELTPDGCCKICKETPNCKPYKNQTLIRENECVSSETVELTHCEGSCPSSSVYSQKEKAFHHNCACCQEQKSHRKEVTLTCPNGTTIIYDYLYVDECKCLTDVCPSEAPPS